MPNLENTGKTWVNMGWGKLLALGLALVLGLTVLGSALGVFSSVVTAPARVIGQTLQTDNIIQSYEWFFDTNAAYISRRKQVSDFTTFMADKENNAQEKRMLRIELSAVKQSCRDLVTKYNANSEKMNKTIFKDWSLPNTLDLATCG